MRVTSNNLNEQTILNFQSAFNKAAKLQNQITTGNQINAASDDPVSAVQILQYNTQNAQLTTDLTSIKSASGVLQTSVDALTSAQSILTSAKNAALTASNITTDAGSSSTLAAQINSAINQLLGVANTQLADGTYIFGGTANQTKPYAVTSSNSSGQSGTIAYQGNDQSSETIVGKSLTVSTSIPGSSVFQPNIGGTTAYSGRTGAKAGTGADTASGQGTLQVQHTLTTYSGGSGVAAGSSSPSDDTVLGPPGANSLTISDTSGAGTSGTISLNGGTPVAFTNADTNLKVTGPSGEVVYLDTSTITPGFKGTVTLAGDGTLSVDGGNTTTAIDFSGNQVVTDGTTGATTNVNTTNVRLAGNAQLDYPGKSDVFQTLIALRDTINNTKGLSATDRSTALSQQIAELERIHTAIATPLGSQSSQAQFLSNLSTRTTNLQTSVKKAASTLQSTDTAAAIVAYQQQENLYQYGLQLAAALSKLSIAKYI